MILKIPCDLLAILNEQEKLDLQNLDFSILLPVGGSLSLQLPSDHKNLKEIFYNIRCSIFFVVVSDLVFQNVEHGDVLIRELQLVVDHADDHGCVELADDACDHGYGAAGVGYWVEVAVADG